MAIHKKHLRDNGIRLKSATENIPDTPEGIILESLLEGMAEYYSAELSQKIKRGMNESRKKGQFTGGVLSYGYKLNNKKIEIDEDKANVVRFIYEQYANGVFVKDIIERLTQQNILSNGRPFPENTVYKILKNKKYAGIYTINNEVYTNIYPRIVPESIFNIVQSKIAENSTGKHIDTTQYLLKNKIFCGYCNQPMTSDAGTARNGEVKRYYKCLGRKKSHTCSKSIIRKDIIEQLVIDVSTQVFCDEENLSDLAMQILEANNKRNHDTSILNILEKEQASLQRSINNIIKAIENGITTMTTKQRLEELETNILSVKNRIAIEKSQEKVLLTSTDIIKYIKVAIRQSATQMIRQLINKVIVYDDKIEIYYNYTDNKGPDDEHQVFSFYETNYKTQFNMNQHPLNSNFEDRIISYNFQVILFI